MRTFVLLVITLTLAPLPSFAKKNKTLSIIANEPVSMMDLGILKLNATLSRGKYAGLHDATITAKYNPEKGTIDIKVSKPVKKASKNQCKNIINNAKKIFIQTRNKEKYATIYHFFQHEGSRYSKRINWKDVENHVLITGIALTRKNYQDSVYCQSMLMKDKVTY